MPVYEFLCARCNVVFSFMVPTMTDTRIPECPRCANTEMRRQLSRFSFVRGGKNPLAAQPGEEENSLERGPERDPELYFLRGEDENAPRIQVRRKVPVQPPEAERQEP
jgi:putative FmdB family regulatory protein